MSLEGVVYWILRSVEVVDMNEVHEHAGEKVTTIGEDNLTALLDWQILVLLDRVCKDIHHSNPIKEANNNLETCRVERNAHGIILELLVDLEFESKRWTIAPNLDCLVR